MKTLSSIEEKLVRKSSDKRISELPDLVGVRLILLFRRDLTKMDEIIKSNFRVISSENTADRLDETQFGYQSNHYSVKIPKAWLSTPSYAGLGNLIAEIQVRTLAQHIWAAASHKFQYKREESVPLPLRRTIHRVSALLETVDLEFGRILEERANYFEETSAENSRALLNVDLVAKILGESWPEENAYEDDSFDDLLNNLNNLGINTVNDLRIIISKHEDAVLEAESARVSNIDPAEYDDDDMDRYERGVFYTHVGLTREALLFEFGRDKLWLAMGVGSS